MKRCAFCNRIATMSGEHIWSEWIDRLLKPSRQSEFTFRRVAEDKTVLASWKSEKLNWKARVVCEPCNNGWMSDLENHHAKPTLSNILLGQPVSLPAKSIASLAAFTFKMTVVTDHMRSTRKPFFKPSVRSAFRRSLRVPSNVQMWLAAFHEPGSRNGLLRSYYVNVPNERYGDFQYLVVTWGIMPFMVQSVARRLDQTSGA